MVKESRCQPKLCSSGTQFSVRPEFTEQTSGLRLKFYLYHDVNVLAILQQTQIRIEVELIFLGAGVIQHHLTVSKGLKEDLLPLCLLVCQQLPLKGRDNQRLPI